MLANFIKSNIIRIVCSVKDSFFPLRCQACGFFLESSSPLHVLDSGLSEVLCKKCISELKSPEGPICIICGKSFQSGETDRRCGDCLSRPPYFDMVRSAFFYEGPARSMVHALKYGQRTRLHGFMGAALSDLLGEDFLKNDAIIIPVPLHKRKLRKRGYNQALLLSESLARKAGDSVNEIGPQVMDILERIVETRSQAGLHKKERLENVKNAFSVKNKNIVSGKNVILVDDVFTTGATVSSCARVLKKAGALNVIVLTFARVRG